jgi:GTP-binding protein
VLVHLIDLDPGTGRDPLADYRAIRDELSAYSEELAVRPEIVVVNKVELPGTGETRALVERFCAERGLSFHAISAVTGEGLPALVHALAGRLVSEPWVPAAR